MSSNDDVPSLGRLDAYQKIVATADPAACITVHSCAGSGKSSTLAMRARVLCEAGVPTHRILLLTFSNRSCDDLTAKLAKVAPAVSCRTHHAHALALLRASGHPQASAAVVEPREQRAIIKEALARHAPSQEKPTSKIVRKLLASFAKAKSTGLPQDLPHSVTDRRCFEDYQELLRQRNQIDFEDMVGLAIEALRAHPTPLQHSHILVDEAQDTSEKQLQLLQLLAPRGVVALTAVGDDDQTIYGFRGSRPDVLKRIGEQWGCHAYMLPTNYRCAPRVLDAARALIEGSLVRAQKPPLLAAAVAMGHGGGELRTVAFPDRATELDALGGELQRLQRQQPGRLSGVAVLCRLRAQVDEVRKSLREYGVRVTVHGSRDEVRKQSSASDLLAYLRLAVAPADDAAMLTALAIPARGFGAGGVAVKYLKQAAAQRGGVGALLAAAQAVARRGYPPLQGGLKLTRPQQNACSAFLALCAEVEARAMQQTPPDVLAWLASQVGLDAHLAKQKRQHATSQTAFTVAMPGSARGRSALASHDSSEEEEDSFDNDDPPGGVGGIGGGGGGDGSAGFLRAAEAAHHSSISGGGGGAAEPAQRRLQRFLDTIAIQLHGEGGGAGAGTGGGGKSPAVTVTTIHSAKGLEWDSVYLPDLTEGSLPLVPRGLEPNSNAALEHIEEERRLAYVGFTRARSRLTLSWSEGEGVKRSRFLEPLLAGGASVGGAAAGGAAAGGAAASGAAARGAVAVPSTAAPRCAFTTAAAACATPLASVANGQLAAAPRCAPAAAPAPASVVQAAPTQTSSHLSGLPDDFFSWD